MTVMAMVVVIVAMKVVAMVHEMVEVALLQRAEPQFHFQPVLLYFLLIEPECNLYIQATNDEWEHSWFVRKIHGSVHDWSGVQGAKPKKAPNIDSMIS